MLAYSTVAHNAGVRAYGFTSSVWLPLLAKDCRSTGNCMSSSRAALCQTSLRPRQMPPPVHFSNLSGPFVYPAGFPRCKYDQLFDLSLGVVGHKVFNENATLMLVKHRFKSIVCHCRECTGCCSVGAVFLFVSFLVSVFDNSWQQISQLAARLQLTVQQLRLQASNAGLLVFRRIPVNHISLSRFVLS